MPRLLAVIVCASIAASLAARELGVDVSHYQNESGIPQSSWHQMFADGKRFAFIKCSDGLGPDDPTCATNLARASAAGILTGVYHVPRAQLRPTVDGAIAEAHHFLDTAGDAIGPRHLRPVLDLEPNNATLSTTALTDWVLAFLNEIVTARGIAALPIVYANRSFARDELDSRVANLDLWLAYPGSTADPLTDEPPPTGSFPKPTGRFNNWVLWQYSWTGDTGGISPVDLDVVHSEYKPLSALIIPEPAAIALLAPCALRRRARH
jgi:lysozyme